MMKENNSDNRPLVVLVGRTNVGKSTLFNRLLEKRLALVSNIENTTRDSNRGSLSWRGRDINLVDTAGVIDIKYLSSPKAQQQKMFKDGSIESKTQEQLYNFLKSATILLFVVDNSTGLLPADKEMAAFLKTRPEIAKKTLLVINKVDSTRGRTEASEFQKLNLGENYLVSALSGGGTGDLLDEIVDRLGGEIKTSRKDKDDEAGVALTEAPIRPIKVCLIGQPNTGKSSLLNAILGYERVIVSATPHTTREPQNISVTYKNRAIDLIDTAGINRHGHKGKGLEKYGILKSLSALKRADIALLMIDVSQNLNHQDAKLIEEIMSTGKSFIILANKWDLVEERSTKKYTEDIYRRLPFATFAPLQFISAKTGEKVEKIFDLIIQIAAARTLKLSDSQLDHFLNKIVKIHRPSKGKGVRHPRIYEFHQVDTTPPAFELRIGSKEDLHFSYVRFIENRLREQFGFLGTPLKVRVTKNRPVHGVAEGKLGKSQQHKVKTKVAELIRK